MLQQGIFDFVFGAIGGIIAFIVASLFFEFYSTGWWSIIVIIGIVVCSTNKRPLWYKVRSHLQK